MKGFLGLKAEKKHHHNKSQQKSEKESYDKKEYICQRETFAQLGFSWERIRN
jgi:hypothetical protein